MSGKKYIYLFEEGNSDMRMILGGKGANLAEMTRIGLPVPPGFTITAEACNEYIAAGEQFPPGLLEATALAMKTLEEKTGKCSAAGNPCWCRCVPEPRFHARHDGPS